MFLLRLKDFPGVILEGDLEENVCVLHFYLFYVEGECLKSKIYSILKDRKKMVKSASSKNI